ncbi:type IV pilin protein [Xylophilus sp. GOD-11R]|uniref:type IV pilin protein n=1 Tax=Xylophilus sp. GOD-11R TaxID=3089814 RepID=UPI00298CFB2C|nr:prepilin-type N-terminal cleavage/methylation domain-containing protein [Xylophilus sp. GOD-11R]WPB56322.1 prepilin-type N-terminal cleavage/methylation domain-containing protein [Xylophilus sp. GOD-11R]
MHMNESNDNNSRPHPDDVRRGSLVLRVFAVVRERLAKAGGARQRLLGYTLVELLIVVGLVGVLAAIAVPTYRSYIERAQMAQVILDMGAIGHMIEIYQQENGRLPDSLADIGWSKPDRWGNPYYYLNMDGASIGQKRKDRSLHPLNSDYDLYSAGPDGRTTTPLTAGISQDDIIRANNGAYIGIAKNY